MRYKQKKFTCCEISEIWSMGSWDSMMQKHICSWSLKLIFCSFEVLMSTSKLQNMKFKLQLEILFWWYALDKNVRFHVPPQAASKATPAESENNISVIQSCVTSPANSTSVPDPAETVEPVNDPPSIISTPSSNGMEDIEYVYQVEVEDIDNDVFYFSLLDIKNYLEAYIK